MLGLPGARQARFRATTNALAETSKAKAVALSISAIESSAVNRVRAVRADGRLPQLSSLIRVARETPFIGWREHAKKIPKLSLDDGVPAATADGFG